MTVRVATEGVKRWRHARLYALSEPVAYCDDDGEMGNLASFVIVSAVHLKYSEGDETAVFPADENGNPLSWKQLVRIGTCSFEDALDALGYDMEELEDP